MSAGLSKQTSSLNTPLTRAWCAYVGVEYKTIQVRGPQNVRSALETCIYYAGTLLAQIDMPRNGVAVRSGLL